MLQVVEAEEVGQPQEGDVYNGQGEHVGSVDATAIDSIKKALTLEILHNGEWYVYTLVSIVPNIEEGENGTQPVAREN